MKPKTKNSIVSIAIMFFFLQSRETTYYSLNGSDLTSTSSWLTTTNASAIGSNPSNFTTNGDIFIIQSGQTCHISSNLTIGSGVNLTIYGTLNFTGSSLTLNSLGVITVKNGGIFSIQTTSSTVTLNGTVSIESGGAWTGSGSNKIGRASCRERV